MIHALRTNGFVVLDIQREYSRFFPEFSSAGISLIWIIEWKRDQFGILGKLWYYANERIAAFAGNRLIADHPEIQAHLETRVRIEN